MDSMLKEMPNVLNSSYKMNCSDRQLEEYIHNGLDLTIQHKVEVLDKL